MFINEKLILFSIRLGFSIRRLSLILYVGGLFIFFLSPESRADKILVEENAILPPTSDSPPFASKNFDNESQKSSGTFLRSPSRKPQNGVLVGRAAAQKYFVKSENAPSFGNSRLLSLHFGGYLRSKAYQWGSSSTFERAGVQTTGVTYKVGEWTQAMDLNLRIDYMQYEFENSKPIKISFLPLLTFPDSATEFPIYFGIGAGPGIFISQMERESNLSLDYQLIFGVRWLDIWHQSGFFIESGIKDHIHLLSDGQFMSQFLTAGAVFRL